MEHMSTVRDDSDARGACELVEADNASILLKENFRLSELGFSDLSHKLVDATLP